MVIMPKIKILIADSQPLFAEALAGVLGRERDLIAFEEYPASGREAIDGVYRLEPDVALIDYWIPGMEGPAVTNAITREAPGVKVIMLSWFYGVREIKRSLEAGAIGFIPKNVSVRQVAAAIRDAQAGSSIVYPEQIAKMMERLDLGDRVATQVWERLRELTPRELEILELLAHGDPVKVLADRLSISVHTLRTHIHRILEKTGTRSQMEAVATARRYGLIQS